MLAGLRLQHCLSLYRFSWSLYLSRYYREPPLRRAAPFCHLVKVAGAPLIPTHSGNMKKTDSLSGRPERAHHGPPAGRCADDLR